MRALMKTSTSVKDFEESAWLMWMPRVIGIVFGILWLFFGMFEALINPAEWSTGLLEGLLIGGVILFTTYIITRWELMGIALCSLESMLVFGLMIFSRQSPLIVYVLLALPLITMAVMAFIHISFVDSIVKRIKEGRKKRRG